LFNPKVYLQVSHVSFLLHIEQSDMHALQVF